MTDELDERYQEIIKVLPEADDPEFKAKFIELMENGFVPFELECLGKMHKNPCY